MSRDIRGYDVMMSLGDVLRTVVANDGGKRFHSETASKVSAVFGGKEVNSTWSVAKMGSLELVTSSLVMPRLHSSAELTRHQADTFVGYGLHELSKALGSDSKDASIARSDSNKMYSGLFDAFESVRVEQELMKSGLAPNARRTFESLSDVAYAQQMLQGYNPNSLDWLPTTVNYIAQDRAGYNLPFVEELKRSMNPKNLKLIEQALAKMDSAKSLRQGTQDSASTARWLLEQLELPPAAGDGKEDDGQSGKGKNKGQGQSSGGQGDDEDGQDGEGAGDGQDGEGDGDSGDGEGSGSGQGQRGGSEAGRGSNPGGAGSGDGRSTGGEGQRSKTPASGKGGKGYSPPRWNRKALRDANPQPLRLDKVVAKASNDINKVAEQAHGEDTLKKVNLTDECRVNEQYEVPKGTYDNIKARIPANLGSMRHALWRLLQSKDEHIVQRYCEYGRWDQRALTRMLSGSQSLYKQEGDVIGMKTCVSIILDLSGSMSGEKAYSAAAACIALAETMEQLAAHGVSYEIIGFTDTSYVQERMGRGHTPQAQAFIDLADKTKKKKKKKWSSKWWSYDDNEETDFADYGSTSYGSRSWRGFGGGFGGYTSWFSSSGNQVGIIQFKGFADKFAARKLHIGMISGRPSGGTPDAEGLLIAIKDVIARPEPNKIVMVITDGMGDVPGVKAGCRFAEQIGVDVIGVGIGKDCYHVQSVYPSAIYTPTMEGLGTVAFTALVAQIEKNRRAYFGTGLHRRKAAA